MTAIPLLALVLTLQPAQSHGEAHEPAGSQEIVGIVAADGRTVLTNMSAQEVGASAGTTRPVSVSRYDGLIDTISRRHGVDPQLTEAVIEVESAFNPNAISAKGALGLMQLIPATGERFGVNNFFDPADNIAGGVRFLSFLMDKFDGNTNLVLAAYNSGENRVERLGRVPAIPETERYVVKVRRAWERLRGSPIVEGTPGPGVGNGRSASAIYTTVGKRGILKLSNVGSNH